MLRNTTKPGTILREEPQTRYTKKFLMTHIGIEKQKRIHKFKMEDNLNLFKEYENQTMLV